MLGAQDRGDAVCRKARIFVLPHANHGPTGFLESPVCIGISTLVRLYLLAPERRVLLRPGAVGRTTVPEATVDEDGQPLLGEYDISPPAQARKDRLIRHIGEPESIKGRSKREFRGRVTRASGLHPTACLGG